MSLADLLRNGVAIADKVTKPLQVPVKHYAWISSGTYAEPVYATFISRKAIVNLEQRTRRLPDGKEIIQKALITFITPIAANGASGRREPIDNRDKLVLPNGFTGPILDVSGPVDPGTSKPFMLEVILG